MYGYIILGVIAGLVIVSIILIMVRRRNKELFARWNELRKNRMNELNLSVRRKERQAKLEKLRPKLELIEKRLVRIDESSTRSKGADESSTRSKWDQPLIFESDGQVRFRARKMFDLMDS